MKFLVAKGNVCLGRRKVPAHATLVRGGEDTVPCGG